jgi:hypothetical protein
MNSATPDPDGTGEDVIPMEWDVGSEEMVRQLDKALLRWKVFGESGWMADVDPVSRTISSNLPLIATCSCCRIGG